LVEAFNFWGSAVVYAFKTFVLFAVVFFLLRMFTKDRHGWPGWATPTIALGGLALWLLFYGDGWALLTAALGNGNGPPPVFRSDGITSSDRVEFLKVEVVAAVLGVMTAAVGELWYERRF
jgi:hypothetical protein